MANNSYCVVNKRIKRQSREFKTNNSTDNEGILYVCLCASMCVSLCM